MKLCAFSCAVPLGKRTSIQHRLQVRPVHRLKTKCTASLPITVDPKLAKAAFGATSKLITTASIGFLAAWRGILDRTCLRALAKTVFNIFLPSLLFVNVTTTLASGAGSQLLVLPLVALSFVVLGLGIGFALCKILGLNNVVEQRLMLVCCGFNNSAALPLLFANALFSPTHPAQLAALTAGISFYLLSWTPLFWSLAGILLTTIPSADAKNSNTPNLNMKTLLVQIAAKLKSPPLIASSLGCLVGCLPSSLLTFFMETPVFAALKTLGIGYGPAAVLVLAGSLYAGGSGTSDPKTKGSEKNIRLGRMAAGIFLTRFVMMPVLALMLVKLGVGNKLSTFAILVESVMPPAQDSVSTVILQLEGKSELATTLASLLAIVYLLGVVPIILWLSVFLGVAGIPV